MKEVLAIFKALSDLKIPSLVLIALVFTIGGWLLVSPTHNTYSAIGGGGMLLLGSILAVVNFVDFRSKDHIDFLLKQYQAALNSISKTHSKFEEKEQTSLSETVGGKIGEKGEYSVDSLNTTKTQ